MTTRGWSGAPNPYPGVKCGNPECGHAATTHNDLGYCESNTVPPAERKRLGIPHPVAVECSCSWFVAPGDPSHGVPAREYIDPTLARIKCVLGERVVGPWVEVQP